MPNKKSIEEYLQKFQITKEYLTDAYILRKLSLTDIRKEKGIDFKACSKLLRYFGIPVRTISEARTTPEGRKKYEDSLKSKYGVNNPSQIPEIKEKKRQTFLIHYGVDNIWKSKKYYEWLDSFMINKYNKKRITDFPKNISKRQYEWWKINTFEKKENVSVKIKKWWKSLSSDEKEKRIQKWLKSVHTNAPSLLNKIEVKLGQILDLLSIRYERRFPVKRYYVDFYLKDFNLIIECYGDYWHANPTIYKPNDEILYPGKQTKRAIDIWNANKKRIDEIKKCGYNCSIIWETEIKYNPEKVIEIIKNETQACK